MSRQDRWSLFSALHRLPCLRSAQVSRPLRTPCNGFVRSRRLHIEPLEDRRMLAVITVTSSADDLFAGGGVTLREAIEAANTDTSIDGSVAGNGADKILFSAALTGNTITLGGTDLEITEALTIDATVLAANVTIDADELSRIFNITATTGDFTLAGLTIIGGVSTGNNGGSYNTTFIGGAIRSLTTGSLAIIQSSIWGNSTTGIFADGGGIFSSGVLTLMSSTVSENSTAGYAVNGGGIYSLGDVLLTNSTVNGNSTMGNNSQGNRVGGGGILSLGSVTLTNSTVSGNSTVGTFAKGGGISTLGDITLTSSTVSGNSTTGDGAHGGGTFSSGDVLLTSSTISENSTTGYRARGGGIFSYRDVTLMSSTVSGNSTTGNDSGGGAIRSVGTITLMGSTISGNSTAGLFARGGGVLSGTIALTNSTISGNSTAGSRADGGGVHSFGSVTLTNSTVSGNSTTNSFADGGGISSIGDVMLTSSTVTDNHANYSNVTGGGIWNSSGMITITNSILAGNTAGGDSPDIDSGSGIFAINFSLLGTAVTPDPGGSESNFNDIPLLGPLTNNGGPTETHALLAGSLAIDAGDPNFLPPLDFDQRGEPFVRVVGGRVDIGAIEDQSILYSADYDADGDVDGADFLAWQRGFSTIYDATDLGNWEAKYSGALSAASVQPSALSALRTEKSSAKSSTLSQRAKLIDAAMAIELVRGVQDTEASPLDDESPFADTYTHHIFAAEIIAPTGLFADDNERLDTNSSDVDKAEDPWLADELLEQVFG